MLLGNSLISWFSDAAICVGGMELLLFTIKRRVKHLYESDIRRELVC